jgi:hypothetical protein
MKTHVDSTHFGLIVKRKLKLIEKFVAKDFEANHIREKWKKRSRPFGPEITFFLLQQILTSTMMKHNKGFLKIWSYVFVKGINLFPTTPKCGIYDYKNSVVCAIYD